MTELDPDLEPAGPNFEAAYALPEALSPELRELHGEILTSLRNEARMVPMGVIQQLLMERIAYFYISMKQKELQGGFGLREQKETLDFWLKMTIEFNRLLAASNDQSRNTLLIEIKNVLQRALGKVKDPNEKRELSQYLSAEFAKLGT